jgi:integrase
MALTTKGIAKLKTAGRYGDGHGLYLQVMSPTNRSWLLRYERDGRGERWMGLGPVHTISLEEARVRARKARQLLLDGIDPIEARLAERDAQRKDEAERITFKQASEKFLGLHESAWRNAKHRQQWRNTLKDYAYPTLGIRPVKAIDAALINQTVAPIWLTKPETANRVKNRVERVLQWVKDGMPLPAPSASRRTKNHPALPWQDIPTFMAELREHKGISARALELLILTAARTREIIGAKWDEFDFKQKVWTLSAERMKATRPHRVPLSDRAIEILEALPTEDDNEFVFIGGRPGRGLSNMALLELVRGMNERRSSAGEPKWIDPRLGKEIVPHGFRSTFKDWTSESANFPNIVSEMALAHKIANKTERAYRRGDLLIKRHKLMREWARYCGRPAVATTGTVVVALRG